MLLIRKINNLLNGKKYYNYYYSQIIKKYKNIDSYTAIYDSISQTNNVYKSLTTINFSSDIEFGSNINKVKKSINSSYRFIKNSKSCDIIFYTTKVGYHKIIIELHFFKSKFVFFKYTFPSLEDKKKIENLVLKKYFNKKTSIENQLITDSNNNYIKIENEVTFSIYYFSKNYGFYNFLKQQQDNSKMEILNQHYNSDSQLLEKI